MKARATLAAFVGVALGAVGSGCANSYDPDATTQLYLLDYDLYKAQVHPFVNRQCGTLDCHGQVGRPFRNYGARGLRLYDKEARLTPGGTDTVEEEYRASYESLLGLEPEATRRVVACDQDARTLLMLRKPAGLGPQDDGDQGEGERHKGGRVAASGSPGYACLYAWLRSNCEPFAQQAFADCALAADLP